MDLFSPITALKGIGPARAKQLARLGIFTLYDLIAFFPRSYEDRTKRSAISALEPDVPACFEAMVVSQPSTAYLRRGMELRGEVIVENVPPQPMKVLRASGLEQIVKIEERGLVYES